MARDRGWNSLFSGQHYLNEGDNKQLQTVPLLARLAAEAGEMTLGLGILLLNLHNPVCTAETVATPCGLIDRLFRPEELFAPNTLTEFRI
jgi:alkanesulfonate monooxygenase SsuD/methylene tetrahydromethanopterin reductase-like flavin-dependent oxidoreductase (luciferase family)